jgi:hypothetical protein
MDRIEICRDNPRYWAYKGKPVLLLGGSVEDNLFQIADLEEHLDLLYQVGGNYVRCTMSCRDEGDLWPFAFTGERYDLEQWNPAFWARFARFLELTAERDIVVQIELWATFDYYRNNWQVNPFNPQQNINYTSEASSLPVAVDSHPVKTENSFFWSVPAKNNQQVVLYYQQRFVDEILSHTLPYGHILYCMDNETSVTPAWGAYWSTYIQNRATERGVSVETTEMWDAHDLFDEQHQATLAHPELYSFVDISQNNHQVGETHWRNAQRLRQTLSPVRPLNSVKIYGADSGRYGTDQDGQERFWRNIIGGLASSRFHRPPSGLGLNALAQRHLQSARLFLERCDIFACEPAGSLLRSCQENGAYATAERGRQYAVYFPDGQSAEIDLCEVSDAVHASWLDISASRWAVQQRLHGGDWMLLTPPDRGHWAVVITPAGSGY